MREERCDVLRVLLFCLLQLQLICYVVFVGVVAVDAVTVKTTAVFDVAV